jgi:KaiC/GvpD/RAD55 family RecA-like ATPase
MKSKKQNPGSVPPYHEILHDLVISIMRAQAEVLADCETSDSLNNFRHGKINRHFAWIARAYKPGSNRHLVESEDKHSLRTNPIRHSKLDERQEKLLLEKKPLPYALRADTESQQGDDEGHPVQYHPTRISCLIKQACACTIEWSQANPRKGRRRLSRKSNRHDGAILVSPLSVAFDYLTSPELPGSRAYALLAIRSYLFDTFDSYPDGIIDRIDKDVHEFSTQEISTALSHIRTSVRVRHWSRGKDPIPPRTKLHDPEGLLRQYLGSTGILWLRFSARDQAINFLQKGKWFDPENEYEMVQSPYVDHLPDLGQIVNELWGTPIPIRGADTVFRGGLKFSMRKGLVVAIHGGPGTGKTSLALALGAYLAPLEIDTLFLTGEETKEDLLARVENIVPEEYRRFTFYRKETLAPKGWLTIQPYKLYQTDPGEMRQALSDAFDQLKSNLESQPQDGHGAPKPCRAIVVVDGLHDFFMLSGRRGRDDEQASEFRSFIEKCRGLRALVVLTTSEEWAGDAALEYLVDVAIRLTQTASPSAKSEADLMAKPDRYLLLNKARHQLCAIGGHGIQIAGLKGLRLSPQINYQLDTRAIWKTRVPSTGHLKTILRRTMDYSKRPSSTEQKWLEEALFFENKYSVDIYQGANIFINGRGSGGKAALAMKIACAPTFEMEGSGSLLRRVPVDERILVVSFLYPEDYYEDLIDNLMPVFRREYRSESLSRPSEKVIRLYPGYYKPNDLFNQIEWALRAAELEGTPYTCVVIDGIHNVFIQFPEIEAYRLIWPQLYALLRSRDITIITTHATLVSPTRVDGTDVRIDDERSEPLRHALVQKTDFRIEVDPALPGEIAALMPHDKSEQGGVPTQSNDANTFSLRVLSAIHQPIPTRHLLWSRDRMIYYGRRSSDILDREYGERRSQASLPLT